MPRSLWRRARQLPRPTRSAALLLLLALILELLGRVINSTGVTVAAAAAVGAVIGDAVLTPGLRIGVVRRSAPARMAAGVPAQIEVTVHAHERRRFGSRRPVVIIDRPPSLEPGRIVTPPLSSGQLASADRLAVPARRGHWRDGGTMTIEAVSPLGGFVRRTTFEVEGSSWVHPAPVRPLPLFDLGSGLAEGATASARVGSGTDIFGIREWRSGDALSTIHWRASARRNQLIVAERERPGRPALIVAVDVVVEGDGFEHGLARAAATAVRAAGNGQLVVVVAGTTALTLTRPRELLDWFAELHPLISPAPAALQQALHQIRSGAAFVWVGAQPAPAYIVRAARAAGAGAVVSTGNEAGAS